MNHRSSPPVEAPTATRLDLKSRLRAVGVLVLLLLPIGWTLLIWDDAPRASLWVLRGGLFETGWQRVHAGSALDQPTIGKWYFVTSFFAGVWTLFAWGACRWAKRGSIWLRRTSMIVVSCSVLFYLSLLAVPFIWTVQYIGAMGVTPRRLIALAWGLVGYWTLALIAYRLGRSLWPRRHEAP